MDNRELEEEAHRTLERVAQVVQATPGPIDVEEIEAVARLLGELVDRQAALLDVSSLAGMTDRGAGGGPVALSRARGYRHLAQWEEPALWLSVFEFAAGQPTAIHDHATWGVIYGLSGTDRVRLYERRDAGADDDIALELLREWVLERGDVAWWFDAPRNVHQQEALGDASAYGLVLMGHDPTGRMQRQYDLGSRRARLVPYRL